MIIYSPDFRSSVNVTHTRIDVPRRGVFVSLHFQRCNLLLAGYTALTFTNEDEYGIDDEDDDDTYKRLQTL